MDSGQFRQFLVSINAPEKLFEYQPDPILALPEQATGHVPPIGSGETVCDLDELDHPVDPIIDLERKISTLRAELLAEQIQLRSDVLARLVAVCEKVRHLQGLKWDLSQPEDYESPADHSMSTVEIIQNALDDLFVGLGDNLLVELEHRRRTSGQAPNWQI